MDESDLTQTLDDRGLLAASRGPGCYAVAVAVPDDEAEVAFAWHDTHDAAPPEGTFDRLAAAERVAYVGASSDVYARLCEHVTGERRRATFLAAFDINGVVDVWPDDSPFQHEFNRAVKLARRPGNVVWNDGRVYG